MSVPPVGPTDARIMPERKYYIKGTRKSWESMLYRCCYPQSKDYPYYGGRGITVCEEWFTYRNFVADMGHRPFGTTLGRRDNDKGYFKENCSWQTIKEQNANKRLVQRNNSSGLAGVTSPGKDGFWRVNASINGE